MKLLIITQKVDINDDVLGFMHGWIAEFAKHCEKLTVICLQKGEYDLPNNVKVLSLGKEFKIQNSKFKIFNSIKYLFRFYKYIWQERNSYDKIFVHMNPGYVVLGSVFWRLCKKKIGLWYTHKSVNLKLRIAEKFANVIFTASKESFRLKSKKLKVMGHGIDIDKFENNKNKNNKIFKIITVGRISPIKDYETLINAIEIIKYKDDLQVEIIGGPITQDDKKYLEKLKKIVVEKKMNNIINFVGSVPNKNIVQYYNNADLSVNLCPTGGMDKAVLESMTCGVPVIAFNKTFVDVLKKYKDYLILNHKDVSELAKKIAKIIDLPKDKKENIQKELREVIVEHHSLKKLIKNIMKMY